MSKVFSVADYLDGPEVIEAYVREVIMEWGGLFPGDVDRILEALRRAGLDITVKGMIKETPENAGEKAGASWSNG